MQTVQEQFCAFIHEMDLYVTSNYMRVYICVWLQVSKHVAVGGCSTWRVASTSCQEVPSTAPWQ